MMGLDTLCGSTGKIGEFGHYTAVDWNQSRSCDPNDGRGTQLDNYYSSDLGWDPFTAIDNCESKRK